MQKPFYFAWRNLQRNPQRNLLLGMTIFVGSLVLLCSLFLADGISEGIIRNLVDMESGSAIVSYQKGVENIKDPKVYATMHSRTSASLAAVPGVRQVRTRLRFNAMLFGAGGTSTTLTIKGIETGSEDSLSRYLIPRSGRMIGASGMEIFLSQQAADQLHVQPGDQLTVVLNTWGAQVNAIDVTLAGVFANVAPWVDYVAYVPLASAQQMYGAKIANQYLIDTDDLGLADTVVAAVTQALAVEPVTVRSYRQEGGFMLGIATANRITFIVFSSLLFIVVGFGIASLVGTTIRERGPELGMLMAIGFQSHQLILLLVLEALLLAAVAMLAAGATGAAVYAVFAEHGIALQGIARNAFGTARLVPAAHPYQFAVLLSACIGMTLVGAIVPARRILKLTADDILRKG